MKITCFCRTAPSVAACLVALLLTTSPLLAHADELQEVARLYKQGNFAAALEKADAYLATKPKDAQMRFNKGLILTEQNKIADAIRVFSALSEDFPELPEPYNNLAVLHASQGQYEKAKTALEMAIRTHPSYSTAHENLGDIYAKMASQAYGKALQLDKSNTAAQTKLAMIKDLFTGKQDNTKIAAARQAVEAPARVPERAPEKTIEKVPEKAVEKPAPEKTVVAEKPKVASELPNTAHSGNASEITQILKAWAKAWSDKDVAAYLAFYANDFRTPGSTSRQAWEKNRHERISKPRSIQVSIADPEIEVIDATHAKVRFKQSYRSESIKSTTTKALTFVKSGERWLIQQENVR